MMQLFDASSLVSTLSGVSNDMLLRDLRAIVGAHRRATANLVAYLGEVDARRLHVEKGFSSLFAYSVVELRFSEDEACRRIEAARLARRFPVIYSLLDAGKISLTVLGVLSPYLTQENHVELLAGVADSTVREAKEWIAARFPQPDVPSTIRKQPQRAVPAPTPKPASAPAISVHPRSTESSTGGGGGAAALVPSIVIAEPAPRWQTEPALTRAKVEALSRDRFLVKFTASRVMKEKIERARDLMSHANPEGDLRVVLERAVDVLIAELEKKRQGRTDGFPRKGRPAKDTCVTRATRREVVARDSWRCSFVADDGRQCDAQAFLEFDHQEPKGRGGSSEAENIRILCRAHNRLAAERAYGEAHISRAIRDSQGKAGKRLLIREPALEWGPHRHAPP